jgi:hypothetical protein
MHQGGFLQENVVGNENTSIPKSRDKGGLVPVTAKIINDSTVNQDEFIEYMGVTLSDISIVGYLMSYNELDTKVKITLWDHTGKVEVTFYFSDSEGHAGLFNFHFSE